MDIASAIDLQSKATSMDPRLCGDDEHRRDSRMTFTAALKARWQQADTLVCVGLDPETAKFPQKFAADPAAIFAFCRDIVDATAEFTHACKPQIPHLPASRADDPLGRPLPPTHP